MDVLIDLIIYLIKQATKSRESRIAPPSQQELQRRKAAAGQQVAALRKTVATQQARTRPTARPRGQFDPASWTQPAVRPAIVPPVPSRVVPAITPGPDPVQPVRRSSQRLAGLKLPFLMGELLAPPVALREQDA
jgi:hypothetical protein